MPQGFPGPLNMAKAMKQMQRLQEQLHKLQEELAERTVEASSGGGAVTAVVDGSGRVRALRIDPEAADPADLEMLQDLVVAAVNEALRQSKAMTEQAMAKLYADLGLPAVPGLMG